MEKQDFINGLRIALNGKVAPAAVEENIAYYSDYIDTQIEMGKTEREVLEALGDPRLIAKTIVMTNDGTAYEETEEYRNYEDSDFDRTPRKLIPHWLRTLLWIVMALAILWLCLNILTVLLPLVLPVFLILFCIKLFFGWLK